MAAYLCRVPIVSAHLAAAQPLMPKLFHVGEIQLIELAGPRRAHQQ